MFLQNGILLSDERVKIVVNSLDDQEKGIIQINVFNYIFFILFYYLFYFLNRKFVLSL